MIRSTSLVAEDDLVAASRTLLSEALSEQAQAARKCAPPVLSRLQAVGQAIVLRFGCPGNCESVFGRYTPPVPATSAIRDFFLTADWHARFDDFVLSDGEKLARKRRVKDLAWRALEDGGGMLTARVQDLEGESHEVEVSLWSESDDVWEFDASCSCPYGQNCQHAAAALRAAGRSSTIERLLRGGLLQSGDPRKILPEAAKKANSPSGRVLKTKPVFEVEVSLEPARSRPVQLLLQSLRASDRDHWIVARPMARYDQHTLPLHTAGDSIVQVETPDGTVEIERDLHAEKNAAQQLAQVGLTHLGAQPSYRFLLGLERKKNSHETPEATAWFPEPSLSTPDLYWPWFRAEATPKLEALGWTVEIEEEIGYPVHATSPADWESSLDEQPGGWFALSVGFDLDGRRLDLLPILAKLLEDGTLDMLEELSERTNHLVYLPDGGALYIPVDRLRRILRQLAVLVDPNKPFLHPVDAAQLATRSELSLDASPRLATLGKRLRTLEKPEKAEPPSGVQATLRDYQLEGYHWMQFLASCDLNGILADDMGLGKTLQTLAHILTEKDSGRSQGKPTLVVAPTSVVPNWHAEAAKFTPSLSVLVLQGPKRKRNFPNIPYADIVLTSFALLARDIATLAKTTFHLVVLDEAQNIKNPAAKVSKAACELEAKHRLCLSGTPVENHLGELWSLMRFLLPGFLGSQDTFRARFQLPIEKDEDDDRREDLRKRIAPLILRRTKDEVASELPPKTILVHPIDLTTEQKDLYETVRATMDKRVREAIAAQGIEQSHIVFLDALLKLRQICCDPRLLREGAFEQAAKAKKSAKLDYLANLLEVLLEEGRRILLFSQFTTMLDLIGERLELLEVEYLMLTGSSKDRGALVRKFQEGSIPLFLISLKAGGTGLNLTAADTVIHYDPWWNPAAEAQATDRAYRIGQTKPVFVHKLICSSTVEERIQKLQADKSKLAEGLLAGTNKAKLDLEAYRQLLAV